MSGPKEPGGSLNEMLNWSIQNSDAGELERRATAGAPAPSRIDQEILDMILGQPTVAKMRECLGQLEPEKLQEPDALELAIGALEELEFHAEDLDAANDLAKIGGVQALLECCSPSRVPELREAACGVLAAGLQNNPPFQEAAVALDVPQTLLRLLHGQQEEELPVRRKALYALSALLRGSREVAAPVLELSGVQEMLIELSSGGDTKLRRRGIFLLLALLREESLRSLVSTQLLSAPLAAAGWLHGICDEDIDVRENALQLAILLKESEPESLRESFRAAGAQPRLEAALASLPESGEPESREFAGALRDLIGWLSGA